MGFLDVAWYQKRLAAAAAAREDRPTAFFGFVSAWLFLGTAMAALVLAWGVGNLAAAVAGAATFTEEDAGRLLGTLAVAVGGGLVWHAMMLREAALRMLTQRTRPAPSGPSPAPVETSKS